MEAASRKRGREQETTERAESDRVAKKLDVEKRDAGGCHWGEGWEDDDEEEMERGVFDFPWLKGKGVMTEEEWKEAAAATQGEETFLGSLGRCYGEEEVGTGGGMPLLEEMASTLTSSSTLSPAAEDLEEGLSLDLEEFWDRDGIWASLHPLPELHHL